jgi:hypothetical protein
MAKIVKIKQKDIENIVKNIISENQFQDTDITDETSEEASDETGLGPEYEIAQPEPKIYLAKDKDGKIYGVDGETGKILFVK